MGKYSISKYSLIQIMVLWLIPIFVIGDLFTAASGVNKNVAFVRGLLTTFTIMILLNGTRFRPKFVRYIWYFVTYILVLVFFSDNIFLSLSRTSKVVLPLLCAIIGFYRVNNKNMFIKVVKSIPLIGILILIITLFGSYFGFGQHTYSQDVDLMDIVSFNSVVVFCLLAPLYYFYERNLWKRLVFSLILVASVMLIIIGFRRTAWLGLVLGFLVFSFYYRRKSKLITFILLFAMLLALFLPQFKDTIMNQRIAREDRFEEGALQKEGRFLEFAIVFEDVFSLDNPLISLFGLNPFESAGRYAGGAFGKRGLHSDIPNILFTTGIIGLILYILHFYSMGKAVGGIRPQKNSAEYNAIQAVWWSLFVTSIAVTFSGSLGLMTYKALNYFSLGAMTRMLNLEKMNYHKMDH